MFRLVVIFMLASIFLATVQCGTILTPLVGKLVSEKVVESHGNSVVHASAPLVAAASPTLLRYPTNLALVQEPVAEIVQPLAKASLVAEKTIEAHENHVVHNAQSALVAARPLAIESHVAIPTIAARGLAYAAPIYYSYPHQLVAEKTVSSYGHSIQHVV